MQFGESSLAAGPLFCHNCGAPVQLGTVFCANCGSKVASQTTAKPQQVPGYYPPISQARPQVSTGAYKAVIGVLLVIIILLGIGLYEISAGHFPFGSRYTLSNPPNSQSIVPPNTLDASPPYTLIWNSCGGGPSQGCTMSPNGWREGGVPDTYDYFVSFTTSSSNVSITVYFFTLGQFVQYATCNGDLGCVSGSVYSLASAASRQNSIFKLAEGCGDYVAIYVSSGTGILYPSISIKQNAAPYTTGYCAQVGAG